MDKLREKKSSRIPLSKAIERILSNIVPPSNEQSWIVNCEYDFSKPLPKENVVKKQIHEALQPLTQPYDATLIHQLRKKYPDCDKHADEPGSLNDYDLRLCLSCGICLELYEFAPPPRFLLKYVSDGEGGSVFGLESYINAAIQEKTQKIRGHENKFDRWWLILIDHIGYVPNSGLDQTELENLRTSIRVEKPWSQIVIVSYCYPEFWWSI